MGPAIFLSGGLILAYVVWVTARWKNDAAVVLPSYLLAVTVQCLHFTEEYVTGFQNHFPRLFGYDWSDQRFVTFNMLWTAIFVLAGLGIYRRVQLAYLIVLFLAFIGGIGNGISHLVLSAMYQRYFPRRHHRPLLLDHGHRSACAALRRNTTYSPTIPDTFWLSRPPRSPGPPEVGERFATDRRSQSVSGRSDTLFGIEEVFVGILGKSNSESRLGDGGKKHH